MKSNLKEVKKVETSRKQYRKPKLTVYGDLISLTRGGGPNGPWDQVETIAPNDRTTT